MSARGEQGDRRLAGLLIAIPVAGALGIMGLGGLVALDAPWWALAAAACAFAGVLAGLVLGAWRAHRWREAALLAKATRLEHELAAAREKLRQALSSAAHDLSQPLTTLYGTLEMGLATKSIPELAYPLIEDALQQARSAMVMTRLLGELAVAGANGNSARSVPLTNLVRETSEDLSIIARVRNVKFDVHGESSLQVLANPVELRRSLLYLVEHALERSPANGTVSINVGQENGYGQVLITDEGPAIAADDLPHWFEPFRPRVASGASRRDVLRLGIVERACASCRGSVRVTSPAEGGACFVLRLPRA
jgi:signal transduction histidine kinase